MKKLISTLTIVLGASISVAQASDADILNTLNKLGRSEERRVGKEGR